MLLKTNTKYRRKFCREKKKNNERTEKTLSGEKCIFIAGDDVRKHVNDFKSMLDHIIEQQSDAWKTM